MDHSNPQSPVQSAAIISELDVRSIPLFIVLDFFHFALKDHLAELRQLKRTPSRHWPALRGYTSSSAAQAREADEVWIVRPLISSFQMHLSVLKAFSLTLSAYPSKALLHPSALTFAEAYEERLISVFSWIAALFRHNDSTIVQRLNEQLDGVKYFINALNSFEKVLLKRSGCMEMYLWAIFEQQEQNHSPVPISLLCNLALLILRHEAPITDRYTSIFILANIITNWTVLTRRNAFARSEPPPGDFDSLSQSLCDIMLLINISFTNETTNPIERTHCSNSDHSNRCDYLPSWIFKCLAHLFHDEIGSFPYAISVASIETRLKVLALSFSFLTSSTPLNVSSDLNRAESAHCGWCLRAISSFMTVTDVEEKQGIFDVLLEGVSFMLSEQAILTMSRCLLPSSYEKPYPWLASTALKAISSLSIDGSEITKKLWSCEPLRLALVAFLHMHSTLRKFFTSSSADEHLRRIKHFFDSVGPLLPEDSFNWHLENYSDWKNKIPLPFEKYIRLLLPHDEGDLPSFKLGLLQSLKCCAFGRFVPLSYSLLVEYDLADSEPVHRRGQAWYLEIEEFK